MNLHFDLIDSLEGIEDCQKLQREIWGFSDISIIPHHLILTSVHSGGLLLGAYDDEALIGFAYSMPGFFHDDQEWPEAYTLRHCSMMAAVLPAYQSKGIGYQLKLQQRQHVLAQGIQLITWTFDPLQSLNARFNFGKLGVICRTYTTDLYGDMRDELNKGLPTDRFTVEWWIDSERVQSRQHASDHNLLELVEKAPLINQTEDEQGLLLNREYQLELEDPILRLQIPESLAHLKQRSADAALNWRLGTREILLNYFAKGYLITDLIVQKANERRKVYYVLENRNLSDVLNRV